MKGTTLLVNMHGTLGAGAAMGAQRGRRWALTWRAAAPSRAMAALIIHASSQVPPISAAARRITSVPVMLSASARAAANIGWLVVPPPEMSGIRKLFTGPMPAVGVHLHARLEPGHQYPCLGGALTCSALAVQQYVQAAWKGQKNVLSRQC